MIMRTQTRTEVARLRRRELKVAHAGLMSAWGTRADFARPTNLKMKKSETCSRF